MLASYYFQMKTVKQTALWVKGLQVEPHPLGEVPHCKGQAQGPWVAHPIFREPPQEQVTHSHRLDISPLHSLSCLPSASHKLHQVLPSHLLPMCQVLPLVHRPHLVKQVHLHLFLLLHPPGVLLRLLVSFCQLLFFYAVRQ